MRPVRVHQTTTGPTRWVPLNYMQPSFGVSLEVVPAAGVTLATKVQITFDDPATNVHPVTLTRAATTVTVVDNDHMLTTGDTVFIENAGDPNLNSPLDVGTSVTVVDVNTYTYTVANTGPTTAPFATAKYYRVADHATLGAVTARANGNVAFPIRAVRLLTATLTGGSVDLLILQGIGSGA